MFYYHTFSHPLLQHGKTHIRRHRIEVIKLDGSFMTVYMRAKVSHYTLEVKVEKAGPLQQISGLLSLEPYLFVHKGWQGCFTINSLSF